MTVREPLVIINGQIQQLPGGDTINGTPPAGADTVVVVTNNQGSTVNKCMAVYLDAADSAKLASANGATATKFFGFVDDTDIGTGNTGNVRYSGIMTGTTGEWDAVTGETGGLVVGTVYYLSSTVSGNTVNAAPTAATKYVVPVGIAINTTDLLIYQRSTVLL